MKRAAAAVLVLCAVTGCARTTATVEIPPQDLPFPVARSASPTVPAVPTQRFGVYFAREGTLVRVTRRAGIDVAPTEAALRALLEGPTARESARRITSGLPPEVRLLGVAVIDGTAHADLSGGFQQPASQESIALRVAQVVWTLTEIPGVTRVRFLIDGEPVAVTTSDGTAVERPVVRFDYARFAPS